MLYSIAIGNLDVLDSLLKYGLAPIGTIGHWNGIEEKGGLVRGSLPLIQIAHDMAMEYGETHTVLIENDSRRAWVLEGEVDLASMVQLPCAGHWTATKTKPAGNHTFIPSIETYCEII